MGDIHQEGPGAPQGAADELSPDERGGNVGAHIGENSLSGPVKV